MPRIKLSYNTYSNIVGDEYGRTAHGFYQQGDNGLSLALNQVAQDITAWARILHN